MPVSTTGRYIMLRKNTFGLKSVTGLIAVSKRSDVVDAESGGPRVSFTNIVHKKMD